MVEINQSTVIYATCFHHETFCESRVNFRSTFYIFFCYAMKKKRVANLIVFCFGNIRGKETLINFKLLSPRHVSFRQSFRLCNFFCVPRYFFPRKAFFLTKLWYDFFSFRLCTTQFCTNNKSLSQSAVYKL